MADALPPPPPSEDGEGDERWRYGPPGDVPGGALPTESYAPWWKRLVAYVLDALILAAPVALVGFQFDLLEAIREDGEIVRYQPKQGLVYLSLLVSVVYAAAMDGSSRGATIGKMAVKIQVRDAQTGGPIGPVRGGLRRLVYFLLFYAYVLPGIANALSPLWDRRSQGWHDKAVRSVVVNAP